MIGAIKIAIFMLVVTILLCPFVVEAHDTWPGYLEIRQDATDSYVVKWKAPVVQGVSLNASPIFPIFCSISDGNDSTNTTALCKEPLYGASIGIQGLSNTLTSVMVRFVPLNGNESVQMIVSPQTSIVIEAPPSTIQLALTKLGIGIGHILMGFDHLLFLMGLLILVPVGWPIVKTITSFTIAHSISLVAATLGYTNVPSEPLNVAIGLSILFLGSEIAKAKRGQTSLTILYPWIAAFAFGLLHGLGFASGLSAMGIPQSEISLTLLLFNIGIEVGQLFIVFIVLWMGHAFKVLDFHWPRLVKSMPAYIIGGFGAFFVFTQLAIYVERLS